MSYKIQKPITDEEKLNFISEYNYSQNLTIEEGTDTYNQGDLTFKGDFLFALEKNEIMGIVEAEIDVPDKVEPEEEQTYHKETVELNKPVIDPDYEDKQAAKRESEFNAGFFQTSLGYIRRSVTMANGTHKDFLSDLLPAISASVSMGQAVNLIAYDKPPFDEDIEDWTEYQHIVQATPQFIQECFIQLGNDFLPINTEEE